MHMDQKIKTRTFTPAVEHLFNTVVQTFYKIVAAQRKHGFDFILDHIVLNRIIIDADHFDNRALLTAVEQQHTAGTSGA